MKCKNCGEPIKWELAFHEWQHPGFGDPMCDPTGEKSTAWAQPSEPVITPDQFKQRWESNSAGGGITFDDIAACAQQWGLFEKPFLHPILEVVEAVCDAADVDEDA